VLRRAAAVVDQVDATARELAGLPGEPGAVRLGWFTSAGAALVPRALAALRHTHPAITVTTREGSTRALRVGTLDLALLASAPPFRPPDEGLEKVAVRLRQRFREQDVVAGPQRCVAQFVGALGDRGDRVAVPEGCCSSAGSTKDCPSLARPGCRAPYGKTRRKRRRCTMGKDLTPIRNQAVSTTSLIQSSGCHSRLRPAATGLQRVSIPVRAA
jgi:DNA-binding transcriptional LysR family regulator